MKIPAQAPDFSPLSPFVSSLKKSQTFNLVDEFTSPRMRSFCGYPNTDIYNRKQFVQVHTERPMMTGLTPNSSTAANYKPSYIINKTLKTIARG